MAKEPENQFQRLWSEIKDYISLNVDYARLTGAEKVTVLLTAVALSAIAFVLVTLIMFFLSMAIVRWIAMSVGLTWAYFIMTGFYLILLGVAIALRRPLIIDPISRFVSKLFFNP